jgi:hypothetical protein
MKKFLLLSLVVSITFGSFAEGKKPVKKTNKIVNSKNYLDVEAPTQAAPLPSSQLNLKGTNELERIYMGKSSNIYSVLTPEQRSLAYNPQLGLASFTFRADPATYDDAMGNSGSIVSATSADGSNWSETWMVQTTDVFGRYPTAAIYNPTGNTDPQEAFLTASGPVTDGSGWTSNFFASSRVSGDDASYETIDVDPGYTGFQSARNGMQVCEDGMAHVIGPKFQDNGANYSTELNLNIWNGEFDGSAFAWEEVDVEVDLALRNDGTTKNFWTFGNAWSEDGSVGYAWLVGQLSDLEDEGGYQPIVFRSTDAGESWDEVDILLEDNAVMSEYLWGTQQDEGPVWPLCTEISGVVDINNELQLFVKATGTSSTHPDSIGYSYTGALDYIFNIEIDEDGVQTVMFIDSVLAADVADDSDPAFGAIGWDSRLQASKSPTGDAVFAVWTDTEDPEAFEGVNGAPNIKAAGRFVDGDFNDFPVTNFTKDDLYAGFYFFMYASQHTYIENEGGANYIHLPVTTSVSPVEFAGNDDLSAVTHSYVKGIKYLLTTGQEEMTHSFSSIEVSQNQPNPFSGTTTINITSQRVSPVIIEVSNLMGQTVYTMDAGTINGTKKVEINAENLQSGVYFYSVKIGGESISRKMIVE